MDDQQTPLLAARLASARPPSVSPLEAVLDFWRKAFTYSGRATRREYNWPLLVFILVSAVEGLLLEYVIPRPVSTMLAASVWVVFVVPWLALVARRCHDLNRPGVFGLLLLATGLGFLVTEGLLIFADSDPRGVRFDPPLGA